MEQPLSGDKNFKAIKENFDSIVLLKLIDKIFYTISTTSTSPPMWLASYVTDM